MPAIDVADLFARLLESAELDPGAAPRFIFAHPPGDVFPDLEFQVRRQFVVEIDFRFAAEQQRTETWEKPAPAHIRPTRECALLRQTTAPSYRSPVRAASARRRSGDKTAPFGPAPKYPSRL